MLPLNGTKTYPLSEHARIVLAAIANAPQASHTVNPGVINRLMRESLVTVEQMPSPFKAHSGGNCAFLCITAAGRAALTPPAK